MIARRELVAALPLVRELAGAVPSLREVEVFVDDEASVRLLGSCASSTPVEAEPLFARLAASSASARTLGEARVAGLRLESAVRDAQDQGWKDADRTRVCDIAFSLAGAFQVEEFRDAAVMARSLGCLMKLTPDQIRPIDAPFREKLQEIMAFLKETVDQALTGT